MWQGTYFFRLLQGLTDLSLLLSQLLLVQRLFSGFLPLLLQECQIGLFLQIKWYNNKACDWEKGSYYIFWAPLIPVVLHTKKRRASSLWPFMSHEPEADTDLQAGRALLTVSECKLFKDKRWVGFCCHSPNKLYSAQPEELRLSKSVSSFTAVLKTYLWIRALR